MTLQILGLVPDCVSVSILIPVVYNLQLHVGINMLPLWVSGHPISGAPAGFGVPPFGGIKDLDVDAGCALLGDDVLAGCALLLKVPQISDFL